MPMPYFIHFFKFRLLCFDFCLLPCFCSPWLALLACLISHDPNRRDEGGENADRRKWPCVCFQRPLFLSASFCTEHVNRYRRGAWTIPIPIPTPFAFPNGRRVLMVVEASVRAFLRARVRDDLGSKVRDYFYSYPLASREERERRGKTEIREVNWGLILALTLDSGCKEYDMVPCTTRLVYPQDLGEARVRCGWLSQLWSACLLARTCNAMRCDATGF